jgi:DNA transformation protein
LKDDSFINFVLDQLRDIPDVDARSMFGAHGLYAGQTFFAIACKGVLYFKTDEESRGEYERRGMKPFRPSKNQTIKSYLQVPAEVIDSRDELEKWAKRAIRAAKS